MYVDNHFISLGYFSQITEGGTGGVIACYCFSKPIVRSDSMKEPVLYAIDQRHINSTCIYACHCNYDLTELSLL